jgi:hypothetical protein
MGCMAKGVEINNCAKLAMRNMIIAFEKMRIGPTL